MTVTSMHGVPILQAHINVSAKKGIVGMESNVKSKTRS